MAKDSYWFRHDSTAGRGLKMRKMAHIYGHWGKGIYWDVIEILRDQSDYKFECDDGSLQLLCDLIGCKDDTKFITWFNDCVRLELFKKNRGVFVCPPLNANMVKWESTKANGSKGGRPIKTEKETETETQLKPNGKPNGNHKIREDNIIEYNTYKEKIKTQQQWLETIYMQYKLKPGSISDLLDTFINHLKIQEKQHTSISEFKKHFGSWLNIQESNGRLNDFKKIKKRREGAL